MAYSVIKKPSDYFNTKLYTGNGSTQSITGLDFQPDFIWNKQRNGTYEHYLFNAITGTGKFLKSNSTDAEGTNTDTVTSFDSDGFTLGSAAGNNGSGNTMASWNWKANGAAVSNTDGTQTAQVSANTTSGFSIVTLPEAASYGGYISFGHGLGVAPDVVIYKQYDNPSNWQVYHSALGTGKLIQLNTTGAASTGTYWGTIDSSVVNVWESLQAPTKNSIAYCFAEKQGFSKFGSYTGNGSTDGTFVYTGFKPAWVMVKCTSAAESWDIKDNKRNPYNTCDNGLRANQSSADDINTTYHMIDYLSNGFKLRGADQNLVNGSGQSYIYMAFASEPLVGDNPATAR